MYVCQNCGFSTPKWFGRCPSCEQWNTLIYEEEKKKKVRKKEELGKDERRKLESEPEPIYFIAQKNEIDYRIKTSIGEFDRVLGGGIVPGSVILIGGEPGVGKSTLLLQSALSISENTDVLYVSSEESVMQIASRVKRISNEEKFKLSKLYLLFENNIEKVFSHAKKIFKKDGLMILDAIQSFYSEFVDSSPGTITQVREIAQQSVDFARRYRIPVILVGHVTKEGVVAGPKMLEHMVDVVIYVEAEGMTRVVRATKNRFGSTGELGIFVMTGKGLEEVSDPSTAFLDEDVMNFPGASISAVVEGTRVYIIEIQALVSRTPFGVPRRTSQGYDVVRLNTIIAVLEKFAGITLWDKDVFLNVAGGLKISDVSMDLAVAFSIASSYLGIPIGKRVAFGEIGLLGEIRTPSFFEQRIKEAKRINPEAIITGKMKKKFELEEKFISLPYVKDIIPYINSLGKK